MRHVATERGGNNWGNLGEVVPAPFPESARGHTGEKRMVDGRIEERDTTQETIAGLKQKIAELDAIVAGHAAFWRERA